MRDGEREFDRDEDNRPGQHTTAEGETQKPAKVRDNVTDDNGPLHGGSADWGSEGGGGVSYYGGEAERKERS
jgi:hypothetical protein